MYLIGAHEMMSLRGTGSGTVDDTYNASHLFDGDPQSLVRVTGGGVAIGVTGTSQPVNAIVMAGGSNLPGGTNVTFSGLGSVTMPAVPAGRIRSGGYAIVSPVTTGGTTVSLSAGGDAILANAVAGYAREIRALPPGADFAHRHFQINPGGEYEGLSYSKGAWARTYGGDVYLTDEEYQAVLDAWLGCEENSLPTIVIPIPALNDPWLCRFEVFNPRPIQEDGLRLCSVVWKELPKYRHPA